MHRSQAPTGRPSETPTSRASEAPTSRASEAPTGRGGEAPTSRAREAATGRGTARLTRRLARDPPAPAQAPVVLDPPAPAQAPVVLDRYRLQRRLGTGAFGTVWLARDQRLERDVAVKILARERIVGGRFEREARAAARLSHPGIVTLYEAAVDDEGAYLVSALVRGTTLSRLLEEGRLSDRDVLAIGIAMCDALEHAHGLGVVHRDVKPSNVLVPEAPASAAETAKLTDFGVARLAGGESLTETGDVIGTLAYMAPEQAEGLAVGPEADLYSLALVIYEALSGTNPLAGQMPAGTGRRRLGTYLPPLRRQRRDLPRELAAAIDLALRPKPRERGTIQHLRHALAICGAAVSDEPGVVEPPARAFTSLLRRSELAPAAIGAAAEPAEAWRPSPQHPVEEPGENPQPAPTPEPWPPRAPAAAATAALTAWLALTVLAPFPMTPMLAALIAAAGTLLLPRVTWAALTAALAGVAATQHHPGTALVIALALLAPVALRPLKATSWPLAAGAPALGLIGILGLAGAWPALAARARTPWRRATLGATGWIWVLMAGALTTKTLYVQVISVDPRAAWQSSAAATAKHLLGPLITAGAFAPALVWALAALVLPWLVRGRSLRMDVVLAVVWAAVTAAATPAVMAAAAGPTHASPAVSGATTGAIAAAMVALGITWGRRLARQGVRTASSGGSPRRLP